MSNFSAGDLVRISDAEHPERYVDAHLAEDDETGVLFTFSVKHPDLPQDNIDHVIEAGFNVELVKPFVDSHPTVPGRYTEVSTKTANEIMEFITGEECPLTDDDYIWTLNEDGTWTDPEGETQEKSKNWILTVMGFEFEPVV